ncbi:IS5/IS1182 family transposase, partial [Ralstonia pseudosolanacearum]
RGLRRVAEQCLLAAAAQNIKKIALLLARLRALLRHFYTSLTFGHRLIAHFSTPSGRFDSRRPNIRFA